MTFARFFAAIGLVFFVAACSEAERFAVRPPAITDSVPISFASVEVRDVSLPSYAAADEIHLQTRSGVLVSSSDVLWADSPERSIALELSQNLARLTRRNIASEPWPFEDFPEARLEVRFSELMASEQGTFRTSGQYFVSGGEGRERSGLFDLSVPFNPEGGPNAIAAARGRLILDLSIFIARNGLR